MKMIRGTLKLALILYICTTLSGVYVLSASARITPHPDEDGTVLIEIVKGDTLWDLCQEHLKDPLRWRELGKYNDFTNPHLIYPGEKLRIPVDMVKDVVQIAEEDLLKQQQELERLKAELAESEATRDKLRAEMETLNQELTALNRQLNELQEKLKQEEQAGEDLAALNETVKEDLAALKQAVEEDVAALKVQIEKDVQQTKTDFESVNSALKATNEYIAAIQADVKTLLGQVEANQKAINEVKMILEDAKGIHEEPSTSKRALVFLTTAAAGIGWFVMNTIGGRSGE